MEAWSLLLLTTVAVGLYMAWNIGANDLANAMGTSVGSRALTLRKAILVAGIFEFAGAVLVGSHVTQTIRGGIVDPSPFLQFPREFALGMFSALLAAAIWLHVATTLGLPVSTTHSIVGAIVGFGIVGGGFDVLRGWVIAKIALSWLISPLAGGIISYLMFIFIRSRILLARDPAEAVRSYSPYLLFIVFFILVQSFIYKGLKNLDLELSYPEVLGIAAAVGAGLSVVGRWGLGLVPREEGLVYTERIFGYLQILTASYVAFAHGANDVANAVGPLAAVVSTLKEGAVQVAYEVPAWVLALGGAGIVMGLGTYGYKVIETVGRSITEISPSRGFSAEFGAATTVLICSKLGLPISTTHTLVGAVIGVGLARGISALNLRIVRNIFFSWLITIPFSAGAAIVIYRVLLLFLI